MLKKRLIFTLLYSSGSFMLSRNFRLQAVGNLDWLQRNYNFSRISNYIDELVVLDVTRERRNLSEFGEVLRSITLNNFVPITAGGGVKDVEYARKLLRSGADKILINSDLFNESNLARKLSEEFGQQCVVGSIDLKRSKTKEFQVWSNNGGKLHEAPAKDMLDRVLKQEVGEIYLNSMDRDGTGQGLDLEILELLPVVVNKPIILAGGVGNSDHLVVGLKHSRIDAVATANLLNFVGDGLKRTRQELISGGIVLPMWDLEFRAVHEAKGPQDSGSHE
jgi:imidazole glycerol-phosphate synthase subunit HisF